MVNPGDKVRMPQQFGRDTVEVVKRRCRPVEESEGRYPALKPATIIHDGIRLDRDVAVKLSDGAVIYVDIYRPEGDARVPAITAWSPFGKRCGERGMALPRGVPEGTLSPGTSFEAADPAYWCRFGYAVVNPDARGVASSEGDIEFWSSAEGRDAAQLIQWIGVQPWCTGKVGMSGNSWLAITQWFAAAERPSHLACIAPWEGISDFYRDLAVRGGIPETGFVEFLVQRMFGAGFVDDVATMAREHGFLDAYWRDKIAAVEKIEVPAYICAGWSQFFHLNGTLRAFRAITGERKWLRAHREFEWPDYYSAENIRDLHLFFDRYLKEIRNGWEMTPRVRLDVMDRGDTDAVSRRAERDFPLPGTRYERWYLHAATATLSPRPSDATASVRYDAKSGQAIFEVKFDSEVEITGYLKLRLWVQAAGSQDMDLFVTVQKVDADGSVVPTMTLSRPHPGTIGMLRASHRELDPQLSTEFEPVHRHQSEQLLKADSIVPLDISIWPTSRQWHAGESLRLVIAGHHVLNEPGWDWFEKFDWETRNAGEHVLHMGDNHDSYLQLPVIPARRPISFVEPYHRLVPGVRSSEGPGTYRWE
jgi:predicted acyl esterase